MGGDFDCDGKTDKAIVRVVAGRFNWHFELSSGQSIDPIVFGKSGDNLYSADIQGRRCDDLVISRTVDGNVTWYYRGIGDSSFQTVPFGLTTDRLLPPSDMNGDGKADLIAVRDTGKISTAHVRIDAQTTITAIVGLNTDVILTGHFSGEAAAEFGRNRRAAKTGVKGKLSALLNGGSLVRTVRLGTTADYTIRPDGSVVPPGQGASSPCGTVVSIDAVRWVLYKPSNLHGGRGPTFLVQNPSERTGKNRLEIRDVNCKVIAYFGLWAVDAPYGARYYQGIPRGSRFSAKKLAQAASRAGSSAILVQGKGKLIKIDDPRKRQGAVHY